MWVRFLHGVHHEDVNWAYMKSVHIKINDLRNDAHGEIMRQCHGPLQVANRLQIVNNPISTIRELLYVYVYSLRPDWNE